MYKSYSNFLNESKELNSLIDRFLNEFDFEKTFGPDKEEVLSEPGWCSAITHELSRFLDKNGVKNKSTETVQFDNNVFGTDDGDFHTALKLGNNIVDLTIGQFDDEKVEIFIGSYKNWINKLKKYTNSKSIKKY